jgi:hypothetical protein
VCAVESDTRSRDYSLTVCKKSKNIEFLPKSTRVRAKNSHQLSLSQLNLTLLPLSLLSSSLIPKFHSTPSLYKAGVEGTCLTPAPGGTGNCLLSVAITSLLVERAFKFPAIGGSGGSGRREWRATESIVKPRDAIT